MGLPRLVLMPLAQSVPSWLEPKRLSWAGSARLGDIVKFPALLRLARKQSQITRLARIGLETKSNSKLS